MPKAIDSQRIKCAPYLQSPPAKQKTVTDNIYNPDNKTDFASGFLMSSTKGQQYLVNSSAESVPFVSIGAITESTQEIICSGDSLRKCNSKQTPNDFCECIDPPQKCPKGKDCKINLRSRITLKDEEDLKKQMLSRYRVNQMNELKKLIASHHSAQTDLLNLYARTVPSGSKIEAKEMLEQVIGSECSYEKIRDEVDTTFKNDINSEVTCESKIKDDLAEQKHEMDGIENLFADDSGNSQKDPQIFQFIEPVKEKNRLYIPSKTNPFDMKKMFRKAPSKLAETISRAVQQVAHNTQMTPEMINNNSQAATYNTQYGEFINTLKNILSGKNEREFKLSSAIKEVAESPYYAKNFLSFEDQIKSRLAGLFQALKNESPNTSDEALLFRSFALITNIPIIYNCNKIKAVAKSICHSIKKPDEMFVIGKEPITPPYFYFHATRNEIHSGGKREKELLFCLQADREKREPEKYIRDPMLASLFVNRDSLEPPKNKSPLSAEEKRILAGLVGKSTNDQEFNRDLSSGNKMVAKLINSIGSSVTEKGISSQLLDNRVLAEKSPSATSDRVSPGESVNVKESSTNSHNVSNIPSNATYSPTGNTSNNEDDSPNNNADIDKSNAKDQTQNVNQPSRELSQIMAELAQMREENAALIKKVEEEGKKSNPDKAELETLKKKMGALEKQLAEKERARNDVITRENLAAPTASQTSAQSESTLESDANRQTTGAGATSTTPTGSSISQSSSGITVSAPPNSQRGVIKNGGAIYDPRTGDRIDVISESSKVALITLEEGREKGYLYLEKEPFDPNKEPSFYNNKSEIYVRRGKVYLRYVFDETLKKYTPIERASQGPTRKPVDQSDANRKFRASDLKE